MAELDNTEMRTVCPWCLKENDLVSDLTSDVELPYEGAVSFCITCGKFAFFTETACPGCEGKGWLTYPERKHGPCRGAGKSLGLRKPTRREQWDLDNDQEASRVLWAWGEIKGKGRR